jgi:hypothetical protein
MCLFCGSWIPIDWAGRADIQDKCHALSGNDKEVCVEEAKAAEKRTKADAKAQYKQTRKAHTDARIAAADADYKVAAQKCDALAGTDKDSCVSAAKAKFGR